MSATCISIFAKSWPIVFGMTLLAVGACKRVDPAYDVKSEQSSDDYYRSLEVFWQATGGIHGDFIWGSMVGNYFASDPNNDWKWDCEDDVEEMLAAAYKLAGVHNEISATSPADSGSSFRHFFGGASYEALSHLGESAQIANEWLQSIQRRQAQYVVDAWRDDAFGMLGAFFADQFDIADASCRCRLKQFHPANPQKRLLSDVFGGTLPLAEFLDTGRYTADALRASRDRWLAQRKSLVTAWFVDEPVDCGIMRFN